MEVAARGMAAATVEIDAETGGVALLTVAALALTTLALTLALIVLHDVEVDGIVV